MYIDPGYEFKKLWDKEIIQKNDPLAMWDFFTNALTSLLDTESMQHLIDHQPHIVRMYYLFSLMSVTPIPFGESSKYLIGVNDEDYLFCNLRCIQLQNRSLEYTHYGDLVYISPLPIIFKIGDFSDRQTYRIPMMLGGSQLAFDIFADYEEE